MTEVDCYIKCHKSLLMENTQDSITVYSVIFAPFNFHPSTQTVSHRLEVAHTKLCLKKDNMKHRNSYSLKFARWHQGVRDENKTGRIFPCNTYII